MGRKGTGEWLGKGLEILEELNRSFVHERSETIIRAAARLALSEALARRICDSAAYVRARAEGAGLAVLDVRASLSSVERLRALEATDYALAAELRESVFRGELVEHELRVIAAKAGAALDEIPDNVRRSDRDLIIESAHKLAPHAAHYNTRAASPSNGYGPLTWIGDRCGVDAEIVDDQRQAQGAAITPPIYEFALLISSQLSCARAVGRSPEAVIDAMWRAANVYSVVVVAAATVGEIDAIRNIVRQAPEAFGNLRMLHPATKRGIATWIPATFSMPHSRKIRK